MNSSCTPRHKNTTSFGSPTDCPDKRMDSGTDKASTDSMGDYRILQKRKSPATTFDQPYFEDLKPNFIS